MTLRVIQWSTGNVGRYALRAILNHPELELAGLYVHSEAKAGRDAGDLAGVDPCGVAATNDADALLEIDADCVCYTATADLRPLEAVADLARILRAGRNVVSSSLVPLVHPTSLGPQFSDPLAKAAAAGGVSFFTSGIDPGFANDVLPLVMSGLCERFTQIRVQEIVNYATYDQPEVVLGTMGFGKPLDHTPILLAEGALRFAWGGSIRLMAEGLGIDLDEIRESFERRPAARDYDTPMGTIAKDSMAGLRFEVQGWARGRPVLVIEHVTRMHDEVAPDWPQPEGAGGYRVIVEGVPRMTVSLEMADEHGDHAVGGVVLTATRLVNAIPAVCAARPGLLSALDLPLVTGRGLLA